MRGRERQTWEGSGRCEGRGAMEWGRGWGGELSHFSILLHERTDEPFLSLFAL